MFYLLQQIYFKYSWQQWSAASHYRQNVKRRSTEYSIIIVLESYRILGYKKQAMLSLCMPWSRTEEVKM